MFRLLLVLIGLAAAGGAWAAPVPVATLADAVGLALADARQLPPDKRPYARYLWTGHLPATERAALARSLSLGINQVSREADIYPPRGITTAAEWLLKTPPSVLAIDVRDYGPVFAKVWEKLANVDPYFHAQLVSVVEVVEDPGEKYWYPGGTVDGKVYEAGWYVKGAKKRKETKKTAAAAAWLPTTAIAELIALTQSQSPIVRGDWFLVTAGRQVGLNNKENGVGYYDFLGFKNRNDFFKFVKFSEKDADELQNEIRAALDVSGVSQQKRQIARRAALTGPIWFTFDVKDDTGRGNATLQLKKGDFLHDAEEGYGFGRQGLPIYIACDAQGNLQASAPDFIGPDDSTYRHGRDGRIHVGIACIRCHGADILKPIDDWARRTYTGRVPLNSPDYNLLRELRRQYLSDLDGALKLDRTAFAVAILRTTGTDPATTVKEYATAYNRYVEERVTPAKAAAELGVTEALWRATAAAYGAANPLGNPDIINHGRQDKEPIGMPRTAWEEVYPLAQSILPAGEK